MYNIKNLAIAPTADMPVRDAAGAPQFDAAGNPLTITFHSPGTQAFQRARHARDERNNMRVFARMQGKADGRASAEDQNAERAQYLADVTVAFNHFGIDGLAGEALYKNVYADLELGHIAEDSEKFLADRGNFMKRSSTASPSTSGISPG